MPLIEGVTLGLIVEGHGEREAAPILKVFEEPDLSQQSDSLIVHSRSEPSICFECEHRHARNSGKTKLNLNHSIVGRVCGAPTTAGSGCARLLKYSPAPGQPRQSAAAAPAHEPQAAEIPPSP
jgi:hypothetical protein